MLFFEIKNVYSDTHLTLGAGRFPETRLLFLSLLRFTKAVYLAVETVAFQ